MRFCWKCKADRDFVVHRHWDHSMFKKRQMHLPGLEHLVLRCTYVYCGVTYDDFRPDMQGEEDDSTA